MSDDKNLLPRPGLLLYFWRFVPYGGYIVFILYLHLYAYARHSPYNILRSKNYPLYTLRITYIYYILLYYMYMQCRVPLNNIYYIYTQSRSVGPAIFCQFDCIVILSCCFRLTYYIIIRIYRLGTSYSTIFIFRSVKNVRFCQDWKNILF